MLRYRRVIQQVPVLPAVGTCGVQTNERDALPGLLEVEPMLPAAERQRHVAADDRFELGRHHCFSSHEPPGRREHVLEELQMGHVRREIALKLCHAALGERRQIVPAGLRHRHPELVPGFAAGMQRELHRAHRRSPTFQRSDATGRDADVKRGFTDADLKLGAAQCTTTNKVTVSADEIRQLLEQSVEFGLLGDCSHDAWGAGRRSLSARTSREFNRSVAMVSTAPPTVPSGFTRADASLNRCACHA